MKQVRFDLTELPFGTLARFGLTQEMIEDLPMYVLEDICQGRHSPVLPVRVTGENGESFESRTRIAFVRKDDGQADVVFYPVLKTSDGRRSKAFVQIDPETKQVLSVPTPIIGRNLQVAAEELHLGTTEVNSLQRGEPLTLIVDDEPVTVGIDLNTRTGIRFCHGDGQRWREQSKREWDKYTFGCYGCWVMDDDGNLNYVSEDDYTEELWNEQKKSAERNRAAALRK